jgi:hypothetical protein
MIFAMLGIHAKCNHEKAEKLAKKKYPGCKIIAVTYI